MRCCLHTLLDINPRNFVGTRVYMLCMRVCTCVCVLISQLRRAYSEKLDVIKSLEERLRLKDRRIRQLEEHVAVLQGGAS